VVVIKRPAAKAIACNVTFKTLGKLITA